jgi:class 3 adenylate cyclase
MEPRVRYALTSDGVSIAYWTIGEGPPLVQTPLVPFSHIEMEWQMPEVRRWYERLARDVTIVRYDGRGNGLSQRNVPDRSLDAHVRDLAAVIEQLGTEPVTILGVFHSGPAAIAFAAEHPERVSHLLLWCTYAKGSDYWRAAQAEGLRVLRQTDYQLFLQTAAHELLGWSRDDEASRFAGLMGEAVEPDEADQLLAATREFDVEYALSQISAPTLVLHRRQLRWLDVSLSQQLAARIAGAGLAIVEGPSPLPAAGEVDSAAELIEDFLGRGAPSRRTGPQRSLRSVLFTDLVGHTEMMSRLGDERGRRVLREHERITREALEAHGGAEVKTLGDGFLASFDGVTDAVECALDLQARFAEWNAGGSAAELSKMTIRVGLNAGEPIDEDGDLFGASVILASRIADQAGGGEILVANTVRELCLGKGFDFRDRGSFDPKGFDEPIRVWEVSGRA